MSADTAAAPAALSKKEAKKAAQEAARAAGARPGKKRLVIVMLVLALLAGAGFVVKGRMAASAGTAAPTPGAVLRLDPLYVNLEGGHYLKLGLALQESASAGKDLDGAQALDHAIALFSGRSLGELGTAEQREKLKGELVAQVTDAYEGDVYDVYFTEFVMQ